MISLKELRQSAAELLAFAVLDLFPGVTLVDSQVTEFGFHYDFIAEQPIDNNAIDLIEEKVRALTKENRHIRMLEMMRENAMTLFEHKGQPVKAQLVGEADTNIVPIFQIDHFHDYCPPPYIDETGQVAAFKILKIEKVQHYLFNEELEVVRIRGTAYHEKEHLKKHVKFLKNAKKVDHRDLGKEMHLFDHINESSPSSWTWAPNGVNLRKVLYDFWYELHRQQRFDFLASPPLIQQSITQTSKSEYAGCFIDGIEYVIPPALSASHALYYKKQSPSYRELPMRVAECGNIQLPGARGKLWGILGNTLVYSDTAHIFCNFEELEGEIISSLHFIDKFIKIFGFEYHWYLSDRGQNTWGPVKRWKKGQDIFIKAFEGAHIPYKGETILSNIGPCAEARLIDSLGREWGGPRLSLDVCSPEKFDLHYQGPDGKAQSPMMLARNLFGSFERFAAILVEHYAGHFPVWLAPEQVRVIPVLERNMSYANNVCKVMEEGGYRTKIDCRDVQLGSKIHSAEKERIPYLVIVGDKEEKQGLITVRSSGPEMAGVQVTMSTFLAQLSEEVQTKLMPRKSKNAK